jgi:mutual gliding-motility protein MglA
VYPSRPVAHIDFREREIALKLVYYGPALSGKTTNLRCLHEHAEAQSRGRLLVLDSAADRTLFFDLLPLHFTASDATVKLKVYTVPGQVIHNTTRKLVLTDVDGIAFIADSQLSAARDNNEAYANLKHNLRELGMDPRDIPVVVQFNKRDLPNVRSTIEIQSEQEGRPVYTASALRDEGVLPTFFGLCKLSWDAVEKRHQVSARMGIGRDEVLLKLGALFGKKI